MEWGSDEMLTDPLIARRCGSTDVLDENKMKTLYLEYPDAGRRYKIRFDVTGFDANSIRVSTDGDRIVVRAVRSGEEGRQYCRKIQKPRGVDHTKFKSYLTADSILIIEAPAPYCSRSHKIRKVHVLTTTTTTTTTTTNRFIRGNQSRETRIVALTVNYNFVHVIPNGLAKKNR